MSQSNLDLLVDIQVTRDTPSFTAPNFNSAMFVTDEQIFSEVYRQYQSAADMLTDGFDSKGKTYRAAVTFFSQENSVNELTIGRRDATTATLTMLDSQVIDNTDYTVTFQGTPITYNSGVGATADTIMDGIATLANADATIPVEVTVVSTGSNALTPITAAETRAITDPNDPSNGYRVLIDGTLGTASGQFAAQDDTVATSVIGTNTAVDTRAYDSSLLTPTSGDVVLLDSSLGTLAGDFSGMSNGSVATYTTVWTETTSTANDTFTVADEAAGAQTYSFDGVNVDLGVQWTFETPNNNESIEIVDESNTSYMYDSSLSQWLLATGARIDIYENTGYSLTVASSLSQFTTTYGGQDTWANALKNISASYGLWTVLMTYDHSVSGILEIASEIEANYKALYFVTNSNEENLVAVPEDTTPDANNVYGLLQQFNYDRTVFEYSATADETYGECGWVGERIWTAPGSSIWGYSQVTGVVADSLSATERNVLQPYGNYFIDFGGVDMVQEGRVISGEWIDTIRGGDNMASDMQIALVRKLATTVKSGSKVQYTDEGLAEIAIEIEQICEQYISRGFIAKTVSKTDNFGKVSTRKGYLVYYDPVSTTTSAQRQSREAPLFTVAATLANAVQKVNVLINLYV